MTHNVVSPSPEGAFNELSIQQEVAASRLAKQLGTLAHKRSIAPHDSNLSRAHKTGRSLFRHDPDAAERAVVLMGDYSKARGQTLQAGYQLYHSAELAAYASYSLHRPHHSGVVTAIDQLSLKASATLAAPQTLGQPLKRFRVLADLTQDKFGLETQTQRFNHLGAFIVSDILDVADMYQGLQANAHLYKRHPAQLAEIEKALQTSSPNSPKAKIIDTVRQQVRRRATTLGREALPSYGMSDT